MRLLRPLTFVCLLCLSPIYAQKASAPKPKAAANPALAKPVEWGTVSLRMFKDSARDMVFVLSTSWIPGQEHKGMFRYKLIGIPDKLPLSVQSKTGETDTPEAKEALLERVHKCDISMVLYDSDDFVLRRVSVIFQRGMDDNAQLVDLISNSSEQMDQEEYRSFVGVPGKSGRYDLTWGSC